MEPTALAPRGGEDRCNNIDQSNNRIILLYSATMFVFLPGKDQRNRRSCKIPVHSTESIPPYGLDISGNCTRMLTTCYYLVPIITTIYLLLLLGA